MDVKQKHTGCKENSKQKPANRNYYFSLCSLHFYFTSIEAQFLKIFYLVFSDIFHSSSQPSHKCKEYNIQVLISIFDLSFCFIGYKSPCHSERITSYKKSLMYAYAPHSYLPCITSSWGNVVHVSQYTTNLEIAPPVSKNHTRKVRQARAT